MAKVAGKSRQAASSKAGAVKRKAKAGKRQRGRPTKYREELAEQARKYCLLGATNEQLAELLEVATSTVDKWLAEKPEFSGAVKAGRAVADARVAQCLFGRATGYDCPEDKVFLHEGQPVIVPTVKHYPPDTTAAIFWLKNRRRADWKDYKAVEVSGANGEQLVVQLLKLEDLEGSGVGVGTT